MTPPARLRAALAAGLVAPLTAVPAGGSTPAAANPGAGPVAEITVIEELVPQERIDVGAAPTSRPAPTSRVARTDPELLGRTGTTPVPILVKLDHDPVATYAGEVDGYAATSPAVTGAPLTGAAAETAYEAYLAEAEARFATALAEVAPEASIRQRLRTVYGGVAVRVPAGTIDEVLAIDGVAAVQADEPRELLTDSSPAFIGADALYPSLGGAADAGRGTTIGILDTGGWPEHPSFADPGTLGPPPGPERVCDFGPDPTTPDDTPFECNHKLIGGQAFLDTYQEERGDAPFPGTARDGNGHGTHVASTAAGTVLESAPVLGADHGPVQGVAPGARIMHYRVCGTDSCYVSDSAAAIQQAIRDRVDVLNFSIGGGAEPFLDPVSLAFLDAYAAGIFPAVSAGNAGPDPETVNHVAPWVTTVAASTQTREFGSTLHLTAGDGSTVELDGVSITGGVPQDRPVVMAADPPYRDPLCLEPAPEGSLDGMIVACQRGEIARVLKGAHVAEGGAAGMILFNPEPADTAADNHWLPAIHLADGADLVAFLDAHDDVAGRFPDGQKRDGRGDMMAAFSSRGPGGYGIKPDIAAPGVQILAGDIPIEGDPAAGGGPAGELFQAIGGTSMASPHIAGSALLLTQRHPDWTPGQIKSALTTTARPDLVKEDEATPADPFDRGSGRVDLAAAGSPGLTLDETAAAMHALGDDPVHAIHLNLPSVNAPVMPGRVTTTRTVTNVTDRTLRYEVDVDQPDQGEIQVSPGALRVGPGRSADLEITLAGASTGEQQFGAIRLVPDPGGVPEQAGPPEQRLPVAFQPRQAGVSLEAACQPGELTRMDTATCTVTAENHTFTGAAVDLTTSTSRHLRVVGADGAVIRDRSTVDLAGATLDPATPSSPSVAPGTNPAGGWVSLADLDIDTTRVGSGSILNFPVPEFVYGHDSYERIAVTTDGYAVPGGGVGADVVARPPGVPDPARPNNLLAPFWTDLDGRDAPGIRAAVLALDDRSYLAVEWEVFAAGTTQAQVFQLWVGLDGDEDISFAYPPDRLPASPHPLEVGAENVTGTDGATLGPGTPPTRDLVVTSSDLVPGGTVTYDARVRGEFVGSGAVTTGMVGDTLPGTTVVTTGVPVRARGYGDHPTSRNGSRSPTGLPVPRR